MGAPLPRPSAQKRLLTADEPIPEDASGAPPDPDGRAATDGARLLL
ncbi:hypothetical protein ACFS5L_37475 [Streptomyces phyllanthi]